MRWLWLLSSFLSPLFLLASASNFTIDDQNGDPTGIHVVYSPPTAWILGAISNCPNCPGPSPNLAFDGTFHGSLFNPGNGEKQKSHNITAQVSFIGTSVSVVCILANTLTNPSGVADILFFIDDQLAGDFSHTPTGSASFQPNQIVFSSGNLSLAQHTLTIQNGQPGGGTSLVILDSIIYTNAADPSTISSLSDSPTATASPAPTSESSSAPLAGVRTNKPANTAAIAGGVLAALAVILLLALAFLYLRHRQNKHRSNVPLAATISPMDRLRSLWCAASSAPRPPPDMAPVPFLSAVTRPPATRTPSARPPPPSNPSPAPRVPPPTPNPAASSSRISRISFNPNLLVGRFRRPPPLSAPMERPSAPPSPALRSGNPLLRESPLPVLPAPAAEPHDLMTSIQEWQRRTLEETANQPPIHPLDMSEVDLSSHYDESSTGGPSAAPPPPPPPPQQPPPRRFTVMNN